MGTPMTMEPLWPYSWLRNVRFHVATWPGGCHVQTAFLSGWISSCAFPGMDHEHCVSARFFFFFGHRFGTGKAPVEPGNGTHFLLI